MEMVIMKVTVRVMVTVITITKITVIMMAMERREVTDREVH
jgi:hypothetical protein